MAEAREDRMLVERSRMGVLRHRSDAYGASCEGAGLTVWLPRDGETSVLVLAAMHGDEPETTVVLSEALRAIRPDQACCPPTRSRRPRGRPRARSCRR
jgi:protein MpaA